MIDWRLLFASIRDAIEMLKSRTESIESTKTNQFAIDRITINHKVGTFSNFRPAKFEKKSYDLFEIKMQHLQLLDVMFSNRLVSNL